MTTIGNSSWGIIVSSSILGGAPDGDICYFFCDSISRDLRSQDKIKHAAGQMSYAIILKKVYYEVQISNAIVLNNDITTMNNYHNLIYSWIIGSSPIYLWIKKNGTYLKFLKNGATQDYLLGRISNLKDSLAHDRYSMSFKFTESDT